MQSNVTNINGNRGFESFISSLNIENALFIASLPLLGYSIAFLNLYSYLNFFDVPIDFINLNFENVILSILEVATAVIFISIPLFVISIILAKTTQKKNSDQTIIKPTLLISIIYAIAIIFIFLVLIKSLHISIWLKSVTYLLVIVFSAFIIFGLPYLKYPEEYSLIGKINKYNDQLYLNQIERSKKSGSSNDGRHFNYLFKPPYIGFSTYTVLVAFLLLTSAVIGEYNAAHKYNFYTLNTQSTHYLLISEYEGQLLLVSFDSDKKNTTNQLKIIPLDEISDLTYTYTGAINSYKDQQNN